MIQKRAHNRFAPVPVNIEPKTEQEKLIYKPARKVVWQPSKYTEMLYMSMFRKWQA